MGDYKLKTAKDYVVPESQRVNADKKRVQLLGLLEQVRLVCTSYQESLKTKGKLFKTVSLSFLSLSSLKLS